LKNVIDLGLSATKFDVDRWGVETFNRLYVVPHNEWVELCVASNFVKQGGTYISKRNGKWTIKRKMENG
jgi:hypothetical protein